MSTLNFSLWPGLLTHTILDPIILSDDESVSAESETDITYRSKTFVNLDVDVTKEWEDESSDPSTEGNDIEDNDTRSTKGRKSSVVSDKNPPFKSNISELRDGQPNCTQSPQLGLAATSPYHSELKNNHLAKHLRPGATRSVCRKCPRTTASIGLASAAGTAEPQPRAQVTAPEQEMVDDRIADDSNDEDYGDMSDAGGSKRGR